MGGFIKKTKLLTGFILVLVVFVFSSLGIIKADTEKQDWISSNNLKFSIDDEDIALPLNFTGRGNRDCRTVELPISEPLSLLNIASVGSVDKKSVCGNSTPYGFYGGGYLQIAGGTAGSLQSVIKPALLTQDNLSKFIIITPSSGQGSNVYLQNKLNIQVSSTTNLSGVIPKRSYIYNLLPNDSSGYTKVLNNQGAQLTMMSDTASFSSNGKWVVFDSSGYGHARLNTETGEVLSFGEVTIYGNGFDPGYSTTISADGRFAVFARQSEFKIFDLENCQPDPILTYAKKCTSRNIENDRKSQADFGASATYIRFVSDKEITYVAGQRNASGVFVRNKYRLTIGDVSKYGFQYLALGDSFASGEGVFNYRSPTDSVENSCHTSLDSYGYLLGFELDQNTYNSVACSGAKIKDIYQMNPENYDGQFPDGITQGIRDKVKIYEEFTPGKITQINFPEFYKPEAITISVGGNDIGFADKLTDCVSHLETCFNTYNERLEVLIEINDQIPRLRQTYEQLKQGDRRVYVVGYPQIVTPGGDCAVNVKLNSTEIDFANKLTGYLNKAVKVAAEQAGVFYVDVENAFDGHKLCETDSDSTYVHGLTEGYSDVTNIFNGSAIKLKIRKPAKESYHPKASGHVALKDSILQATNNLTNPMPEPNPGAEFVFPGSTDGYWGLLAPDGSTIYLLENNDFVIDRINVSQEVDIAIKGLTRPFAPVSPLDISIHSNPTDIPGNYYSDENGDFEANLTVPDGIDPGFHSIHIRGKDIAGHDIDVYDYVFIGTSYEDFDGDGIIDKDEPCVFVDPVDSDIDRDGIDDACDGIFTAQAIQTPELIDDGNNVNDLPNIEDSPNLNKDTLGTSADETVAGNEPTNPKPESSTDSTQNDQSLSTGPQGATNTNQSNASGQDQATDNQVLGEDQNQRFTTDTRGTGIVGDDLAVTNTAWYKKTSFYYWLVGILAVILAIFYIQRRRTRPSSS